MSRRPILSPRYGVDTEPAARSIITRDGDLFVVTVTPPQPNFDQPETFATWRAARGFASGIRMSLRFPIDDQSGGQADG